MTNRRIWIFSSWFGVLICALVGDCTASDEVQVALGYGTSSIDGNHYWGPTGTARFFVSKEVTVGFGVLWSRDNPSSRRGETRSGRYHEFYGEAGYLRFSRNKTVSVYTGLGFGWASLHTEVSDRVGNTDQELDRNGPFAGLALGVAVHVSRTIAVQSTGLLRAVFMNQGTEVDRVYGETVRRQVSPQNMESHSVSLAVAASF